MSESSAALHGQNIQASQVVIRLHTVEASREREAGGIRALSDSGVRYRCRELLEAHRDVVVGGFQIPVGCEAEHIQGVGGGVVREDPTNVDRWGRINDHFLVATPPNQTHDDIVCR